MVLKGIKNIIFDIGGVLVDLDMDRCVKSFEEIGFHDSAKLVSYYHPAAFFGELERGEITREEFCEEVRHVSGMAMSDEQICSAYCSLLVGIPRKKLQLLKTLRERGFRLFALSNISEVMISRIYEFFTQDGLTAADYFDDMFLSFEMGVMKPDPKIYEMILQRSGIDPSETLFIDDAEKNISAAREFSFMVYLAEAHEEFDHLFE